MLQGLIRVLTELMINDAEGYDYYEAVDSEKKYQMRGYMEFKKAMDLYSGYQENNTDADHFRDILLDKEHGLCVYIVNIPVSQKRLIFFKSDRFDFIRWVEELYKENDLAAKDAATQLVPDFVKALVLSMESEWDKKCLRFVLASCASRSTFESCGFDADLIPTLMEEVKLKIKTIFELKESSKEIVVNQLQTRNSRTEKQIKTLQALIDRKRMVWSQDRLDELTTRIEELKSCQVQFAKLLEPETPYHRQLRNQMEKRKANQLFDEERVKKRKKSNQGPTLKLDSADEEFISKSIEDKATYHGRRHDLVLYTNRRVKKRDLQNIANYRLLQRGKRLIKSATTAYNRSRPKNIRSKQAKNHKGKGLFCCKKPPKTEDCDNENTHYQRAHVKNIKMRFFSQRSEATRKFCFMRSIDDKAYIRPGTSEGLEKTRNVRILTLDDANKARQLPKYDWPEKLVYQTPSSHRIFIKVGVMEGENEKLITEEDNHFVFVRPKAIVGSNGSVWASETIRLRQEQPRAFEVPSQTGEKIYSSTFRQVSSSIKDDLILYLDMTDEDDLAKITDRKECRHRIYEHTRLDHLCNRLKLAVDKADELKDAEFDLFTTSIITEVNELILSCRQYNNLLNNIKNNIGNISKEISIVTGKCQKILQNIQEFCLPPVKPVHCDLTDAGPGVGVSNVEVKFREAELARIHNSDYRIRCHRSRGDSGQNEAERTNAAIGDSLVDGQTIQWEKKKRFDGLTEEEIAVMTLSDYEKHEDERMKENAWCVAQEIVDRIQDAPVMNDFIMSYISEKPCEQYFFNADLIHEYKMASAQKKQEIPGANYIAKILDFYNSHFIEGELFIEYLRYACTDNQQPPCSFCCKHSWVGPPCTRIPQPAPNEARPGHYKDVFETSEYDEDGNRWAVDYWQPRAQIKKLVHSGDLNIGDSESISAFAFKYAVGEVHIKQYIQHLLNLEKLSKIRQRERVVQHDDKLKKQMKDYDWLSLVIESRLDKLLVAELDKNLQNQSLSQLGKKPDKIKRITAHVLRASSDELVEQIMVPQGEAADTEESEDDIVINSFGETDSSDSDDNFGNFAQVTTRSGRVAGSWKNTLHKKD